MHLQGLTLFVIEYFDPKYVLIQGPEYPRLDKTSSTLLLKQPNSLDVDTQVGGKYFLLYFLFNAETVQDLRKTKSAENIQCCPRIIIDQV